MKRHNFDKLTVYTDGGTTWLLVYIVAIVNVYVLFTLYRLLTVPATPALLAELRGGRPGFAFAYGLFLLLDFAAAVGAAVFLPALSKGSYRAFWVHSVAMLTAYPLALLLTVILGGRVPQGFALPQTMFYLAWAVLTVCNIIYFAKRRTVFETDIVKMVSGQEKDTSKH